MKGVPLLVVIWAYLVGLFLGVAVLLERADRPGWVFWFSALVGLLGVGVEHLRLARKTRLAYQRLVIQAVPPVPRGRR